MSNLMNLVALVTGAGDGIGKASAMALAEAGATLIVNDIDEADWDRIHRVNAKGVFFCLNALQR
jgi:NAD(P)-dependent dehydrogenase (short-subunit alcohol dehydrogenase family)